MNNLKILLKNNVYMLIGRLFGKKKRLSNSAAIALLVVGSIGLIALYSLQSWSMFVELGKHGLGKLCVFHGIITTLTTLLIIGVMRVTAKTKGSDTDFLLSLPIKKRDIIISKLVSEYFFDLFFCVMLLLPFIVMYEITAPIFELNVLIFGIITVLFLPLLSVGISQIMKFITVKLFNRIKIGNVLKSLIPTIIFITLMALMITKTSGYGTVKPDSMEAYFSDRWVSNKILQFIFDQSIVSILVFIALTIIPAVLGVILQINIYGKDFGTYVNKKENFELKDKQSPFARLSLKEIKYYFTTPAYLVNTIIGPIIILVASIGIAIFGKDFLLNTLNLKNVNINLEYILLLVLNMCIAMTCISCVSISLEGKTLWFIKSMPISKNQFLLSKLVVPFVIVMPVILISSIIFGFVLNSVISFLVIFGIASLFFLINDVSGLIINILFPKLNWDNEVQVVKQSLSVLVAMLFNTIVALIPVGLFFIPSISIDLVVLLTIIIYITLFITLTTLLFTKCKKMLDSLSIN